MGAVAHINDYKKGHYFSNKARGDMSWNGYETNVLMRNLGIDENGTPQFADVAMAVGADDILDSRGIGVFDFDHDGDLDIAVSHNPGDKYEKEGVSPGLYRNDIGSRRSWLAVELEGTTCNRDAIGAEVYVTAGADHQMRLMSAGSSYASQHSRRLYFGLEDHQSVDRLVVRWPDGLEESFQNLATRQLVRIKQGQSIETLALPSPQTGKLAGKEYGKAASSAATDGREPR